MSLASKRSPSFKRVCAALERSAQASELLSAQVAELLATNQGLIAILVDRYEEDHQEGLSADDNEAVLD